MKDWIKSKLPVEVIEPLPSYAYNSILAEELRKIIARADADGCVDADGNPLVTIIDTRSSFKFAVRKGSDRYRIKTECQTISALLDDFYDKKVLDSVPERGLVVVVCETGNRDLFLVRYLSKFGHENLVCLQFGMRGWLKAGYPVIQVGSGE